MIQSCGVKGAGGGEAGSGFVPDCKLWGRGSMLSGDPNVQPKCTKSHCSKSSLSTGNYARL